MKLSTRLYGTVGTLALTGMLVAGTGMWCLRTIGRELTVATDKTAINLDLINAARARAWEMVATLRGMAFSANFNDQADFDAKVRQFQAAFKRTGEQIAQLRPLLTTEEGAKNLTKFESGLGEFKTVGDEFGRLCREHKLQLLPEVAPEVQNFADLSDEALGNLKIQQRGFLKESQTRSAALQSQGLLMNILMGCVLLAIAVLAVFLTRDVIRTLATAVGETTESADQVALAASQISSSSQSLAQGSSEQAASLEETSASSKEVNSMAHRNTENSRAAAELVGGAQQKFMATKLSLEQMVAAMAQIKTQSDKISKIIKINF